MGEWAPSRGLEFYPLSLSICTDTAVRASGLCAPLAVLVWASRLQRHASCHVVLWGGSGRRRNVDSVTRAVTV